MDFNALLTIAIPSLVLFLAWTLHRIDCESRADS